MYQDSKTYYVCPMKSTHSHPSIHYFLVSIIISMYLKTTSKSVIVVNQELGTYTKPHPTI